MSPVEQAICAAVFLVMSLGLVGLVFVAPRLMHAPAPSPWIGGASFVAALAVGIPWIVSEHGFGLLQVALGVPVATGFACSIAQIFFEHRHEAVLEYARDPRPARRRLLTELAVGAGIAMIGLLLGLSGVIGA